MISDLQIIVYNTYVWVNRKVSVTASFTAVKTTSWCSAHVIKKSQTCLLMQHHCNSSLVCYTGPKSTCAFHSPQVTGTLKLDIKYNRNLKRYIYWLTRCAASERDKTHSLVHNFLVQRSDEQFWAALLYLIESIATNEDRDFLGRDGIMYSRCILC